MKVNDIQSVVRGLDPREAQRQTTEKDRATQADQNSRDGDKLEISVLSKITSEYSSNEITEADQTAELTAQEIGEIRARIADGHYDRPETLKALAQQIRDFYGQ